VSAERNDDIDASVDVIQDSTLPVPAPPPIPCLPAPADLTPDELTAFEQMNDALRAQALKMRELASTEIVGLLQSRYELGSIVLDIKNDPATYGALSDIQLASFFGESGKTLYAEARRIRERYEPARFNEIMAAINSQTGARIHYKHLAVLLRIEDDSEADKVLDVCLSASWNTKELADYVTKKIREAQGAQRPRARSKPTNFLGVLEHISANNEEWHKTYQDDWGAGQKLIDSFKAVPEERQTEDLSKKVEEAAAAVRQSIEAAKYLAGELDRIKRQIDGNVKSRRQGVQPRAKVSEVEEPDEMDEDDED
jgi:hypothetical protein